MPTHHDGFTKYAFRHLARAREELSNALGAELSGLIDWSTLALEPTELADDALDARFTDLHFTARLSGLPVRLELVFEHQSTIDPWMPVRLFCHAGAVWNGVRREREKEQRRGRKRAQVPLVLSVVLHTGPQRWVAPRELVQVIEGGALLAKRAPHLIPTFPIVIDDLAAETDEAIRARRQSAAVRLTLLLLKHGRTGNIARVLEREEELVRQTEAEDEDLLRQGVHYAYRTAGPRERRRIRKALKSTLGRKGEDIVVTIADQLIAQGRAQGRAEGEARTIVRFLRARGLRVPAQVRAQIEACTDKRQLSRWTVQAASATSAQELTAPKPSRGRAGRPDRRRSGR
jgi:predicted transposase YdaD